MGPRKEDEEEGVEGRERERERRGGGEGGARKEGGRGSKKDIEEVQIKAKRRE